MTLTEFLLKIFFFLSPYPFSDTVITYHAEKKVCCCCSRLGFGILKQNGVEIKSMYGMQDTKSHYGS